MPIENVCSECGIAIKVRTPKNFWLAKILRETTEAVCKTCDQASSWRRIK